jgi:thiol-disulfide isomerase/thioredoxin
MKPETWSFMKNSSPFRLVIAIAILTAATCGTRAEVMVGDKAPKLQTGKWVQGEPVRVFDGNHVYIVEFWATWCGPCVQSIPHLNALWQKFKNKGVIVIGQDVWDSDNAVAPFVKKMGTNMTYRVALDDKSWYNHEGFMAEHWWKRGTNYHGIPTAFIVNQQGRIAWIGHPMTLKEQVLEDIVSGHYDLAKATVEYRKDREADQQFQALQKKLASALDQKKWDDAETALDSIQSAFPHFKNSFIGPRLKILLGRKQFAEAFQFADEFSKSHSTNDIWQNELAWTIATSESPDQHCLELAETMAERGVQLTDAKNTALLDTLARVQFRLGKKEEAMATEGKAVNLESNPKEKVSLEKTLASYQEGKLPQLEE